MNNTRRVRLSDLADRVDELHCELEGLLDDEREYLRKMPENLCNSERYERSDAACDAMEETLDELDSSSMRLREIIE